MERDGNDAATQYYRWTFMAAVCREAADIAQARLVRGEKVDTGTAYELAILELLKRDMYTKNDIASLSSLLMLGAYACKHLAYRTAGFALQMDAQPSETPTAQEGSAGPPAQDTDESYENP